MAITVPWEEKYRPSTIDDIILQPTTKKTIMDFLKDGPESMSNMIFSGHAGTGKTTLAKVIAKTYNLPYLYVDCSDDTGIDVIRSQVKTFCTTMTVGGELKLVILDESDRLSSAAQDMLKGVIQNSYKIAKFIFTCNSPEKIIVPLKSRAKEVYFKPVEIKLVGKRIVEILKNERINISQEQKGKLSLLIKKCYPDIRQIINHLQFFSSSGDLEINFDELVSEDIFEKIVASIKKKKMSEVRELLRSQKLDYDAIIKKVFESLLNSDTTHFKELNEGQRAECLIHCSEYLYRTNFVIDKEINFCAFVIEIMRTMKVESA